MKQLLRQLWQECKLDLHGGSTLLGYSCDCSSSDSSLLVSKAWSSSVSASLEARGGLGRAVKFVPSSFEVCASASKLELFSAATLRIAALRTLPQHDFPGGLNAIHSKAKSTQRSKV